MCNYLFVESCPGNSYVTSMLPLEPSDEENAGGLGYFTTRDCEHFCSYFSLDYLGIDYCVFHADEK